MEKAIQGTSTSFFVRTEASNVHLVIDWMLFTKEIARVIVKTVRRDTAKDDTINMIVIEDLTAGAANSLQNYINERI